MLKNMEIFIYKKTFKKTFLKALIIEMSHSILLPDYNSLTFEKPAF